MIAHLFKMVWNRKRWNILILLEIFLSFLVLFAVGVIGFTLLSRWVQPSGYDIQDVRVLQMNHPNDVDGEYFRRLDAYLAKQPEIKHYAFMNSAPYRGGSWIDSVEANGNSAHAYLTYVSPEIGDTLGLQLSEGRMLEERDGQNADLFGVLINQYMADKLWPGESAVGKRIPAAEEADWPEMEVVGVLTHYRRKGDLQEDYAFVAIPLNYDNEVSWWPPYALLKTEQGTGGVFEERLLRELERLFPTTSVAITPMEQLRSAYLQQETAQLRLLAVIAFFLLAMVVMGLLGVLWQHVTRRTAELGVRRAKGATRNRIYTQITGEFLVVATLALILGLIAVVQIPVIGLFEDAGLSVLAISFVAAGAVIYVLTFVSSLYPGWLATRVNPAEALHYE